MTVNTSRGFAAIAAALRARMIEHMQSRRLGAGTRRGYLLAIDKLARYLGRSPDTATPEDLRGFVLHLGKSRLTPASVNSQITALRFFWTTLGREENQLRTILRFGNVTL